jgi:hypothetical protein
MTTEERKKLNRNRKIIWYLIGVLILMISWVNSLKHDIDWLEGQNESLKINAYNKDLYIDSISKKIVIKPDTIVSIPVVKKKVKILKKDIPVVITDTIVKIIDTTSLKIE